MKEFYHINVAGVERDLPLCKLNDNLQIAAFVIFGDVEMTVNSAKELLKLAPEHDIMITAESKGIPLIHEMARQEGTNYYLIARKAPKLYMKNVVSTEVTSITTAKKQVLYVDEADCKAMAGKRVIIIDDVISTGESLRAVEKLVKQYRRQHCRQNGDPCGRRRQVPRRHHYLTGTSAVRRRGRSVEIILREKERDSAFCTG